MQPKIIKPNLNETLRYGRRSFVRKLAMASGCAVALPNLLVNRTYAGVASIVDSAGDKMISLSNACFARPFDIGTWNTARIGILWNSTGAGISITADYTPLFALGLCSGASNLVLDASTDHYVGTRTTQAGWTMTAGTPDYYNQSATFWRAAKRVGSTWTNATSPGQGCVFRTDESGTFGIMLVQFTKGSPWTLYTLTPTNNTFVFDRATLLAQMVDPSLGTTGAVLSSAMTLTVDEGANGTLDHITVGWARPEYSMQITDIAVSKINV